MKYFQLLKRHFCLLASINVYYLDVIIFHLNTNDTLTGNTIVVIWQIALQAKTERVLWIKFLPKYQQVPKQCNAIQSQ